jgi:hypothetical protein
MRALALAALVALGGCVVAAPAPPRRPPPPAPHVPQLISQDRAIEAAFQVARERELRVDRVELARLDAEGRWHVDLRGGDDRALVILDGRDGRLLRGSFKAGGASGGRGD